MVDKTATRDGAQLGARHGVHHDVQVNSRSSTTTSPSTSGSAQGGAPQTLLFLDPDQLEADQENVRRDSGDLEALAASLRRYGVLQPLGVTQVGSVGPSRPGGVRGEGAGEARYRVVYGNRRREAAILAGLEAVPCVQVVATKAADHLVTQLLENMQRRDLNDMEQAEGLARLRRHVAAELGQGAKAEQLDARVSEMVGLAPRTVRRYLALRELPPAVRDLLSEGKLTVTQAQHLNQVGTPTAQEEVAGRAAEEEWTAAQVSRICAALARSPGLTVDEAVETASEGWTAVERLGPARERPGTPDEAPRRLGRGGAQARATEGGDGEADLWLEDATGAPTPEATGEADVFGNDAADAGRPRETANGHRVFRIKTVAAFCDEVDRLARCVQEGDLAKALRGDATAPTRLALAAKQLGYTLGAVEELLG